MNITKDKYVSIHYTLKDVNGKQLDTSIGAEPLAYIHGNGLLIAGLERELEGKIPGDKFNTTIKPEDAYGERNEKLVVFIPRDRFDSDVPIEVGHKFSVETPAGPMLVSVVEVQDDKIKIDGNHELAGQTLNFDIEVVEVRDATTEELEQINNCGCGGCGNCGGACNGDCGEEACEGCGGSGVCKNE